jgi:long-chain acyl-CoA synthetase
MPYGLVANAEARPGHVAVVDGERRLTYRELDEAVNRAAAVLAEVGVGPGGRVALLLPNGAEFLVVSLAAGKLGAVGVPINFHWLESEIAHVLSDATPDALVVHAAWAELAARARARADGPARETCFVVGESPVFRSFDEAMAAAPSTAPPVGVPTGGFNMLIYTSGTTGKPKGVVHPSFDPKLGFETQKRMVETWGFEERDVHLVVGPLYHTMPNAYAMQHLFVGATVVVMGRFDAERCLALIEAERVTTTSMVPAHFVRILALPEEVRARHDVSSLRRVLHAAAPCPPDVKRRIMAYFPPGSVWEFYGATEGPGTIISPEEWERKPGSVGRPWPGVGIRVLDDAGRDCAPGEVGTIFMAPLGGHGFRYHNDAEKTAESYRDGLFTVGDMGYLDEDGYLFIADRKHDMVISGGVNIYPSEVEAAIAAHPEVVDVAVFGVPDDEWGESLLAMVEPFPGALLTPEDVDAWCRAQLARYKCPRRIELVDELPRDPNGKVVKRKLREPYWVGRERRV